MGLTRGTPSTDAGEIQKSVDYRGKSSRPSSVVMKRAINQEVEYEWTQYDPMDCSNVNLTAEAMKGGDERAIPILVLQERKEHEKEKRNSTRGNDTIAAKEAASPVIAPLPVILRDPGFQRERQR